MKSHPAIDASLQQLDSNQKPDTKGTEITQSRVIRDGFSMPFWDYQLVQKIRRRLLNFGVTATKSEVLRAALHALKQLTADEAAKIAGELEPIKTGRPPEKKQKGSGK